MSRNVITPEVAEANRSGSPGAHTFHAPIPDDYFGISLTVACVRLGDHAHIDVDSGRHNPRVSEYSEPRESRGYAGRLVLRWGEWLKLRDVLEAAQWIHVVEVENPTHGQLTYHTRTGPPPVVGDLTSAEIAALREAAEHEKRASDPAALDRAYQKLGGGL